MFGSHKAGDVASNFKRTERVAMMLEHGEGGPAAQHNQPTDPVSSGPSFSPHLLCARIYSSRESFPTHSAIMEESGTVRVSAYNCASK